MSDPSSPNPSETHSDTNRSSSEKPSTPPASTDTDALLLLASVAFPDPPTTETQIKHPTGFDPHIFAQHGAMMSERNMKTESGLSIKVFCCLICDKPFSRRNDLNRHMRIHTNDRPFKCTWEGCGKAFIQKCALTVHLRTHTKEKPLKCVVEGCTKAFSDSSSLARHRRTHHQNHRFVCPITSCGRSFTRKATMMRHLLAHGEDKRDGSIEAQAEHDKRWNMIKTAAANNPGLFRLQIPTSTATTSSSATNSTSTTQPEVTTPVNQSTFPMPMLMTPINQAGGASNQGIETPPRMPMFNAAFNGQKFMPMYAMIPQLTFPGQNLMQGQFPGQAAQFPAVQAGQFPGQFAMAMSPEGIPMVYQIAPFMGDGGMMLFQPQVQIKREREDGEEESDGGAEKRSKADGEAISEH